MPRCIEPCQVMSILIEASAVNLQFFCAGDLSEGCFSLENNHISDIKKILWCVA